MRIATSRDAVPLLQPFFEGAEGERVAVLHMDAGQRVIGVTREGAGGTEDDADLPIAAIIGSALRLGAAAIIVAHNHPSGDPSPSEEDVDATRRLSTVARAAGVRLLDHLIFAGGEARGLTALGLL